MKKNTVITFLSLSASLITLIGCQSGSTSKFKQVYLDDPEDIDLSNAIEVNCDFSNTVDPALVKKVQHYNAGCIEPISNYDRDMEYSKLLNPESLRIDVSLGKEGTQGGYDLVTEEYDYYDYDPVNETYKIDETTLNFNFETLDNSLTYFEKMDVLPYLSWCYIPLPLADNGEFRNLNNRIENWQDVWEECYYNYAKHYKEKGIQIGYHEMYNEPDIEMLKLWGVFDENEDYFLDLNDFAPNGNPSEGCYFDMYDRGVKGILRADEDATVGGPAFALGELGVADWVGFLPKVKENRSQMDFYSFHSYLDGETWFMDENKRNQGEKNELEKVVDGLQSDKLFLTTDVHINEYSCLNNDNGAMEGINAEFNYYEGAVDTVKAIFEAVDRTGVNLVHWAQIMSVNNSKNDPYGIITKDGNIKAAYNALLIYQDMPVWRYESTSSKDEGVNSVASSSNDKISILLWNENESEDKTVNVKVNNPKFEKGNRKIYRIDENHASYFNETEKELLSAQNLKYVDMSEDNASVWAGNIPSNGIVYITIDKNDKSEEFYYKEDFTYYRNDFANDIKVSYYHEDRYRDLKGSREEYIDFKEDIQGTYSHFDRKLWKMYLGMGDLEGNSQGRYENQGVANGAVIADNIPTKFKIRLDENSRVRHTDKYSSFGVRVDFYDDNSKTYTNSVYFHEGIYTPNLNPNDQDPRLAGLSVYPWGTKTYADQQEQFEGRLWDIDLSKYAPEGWANGSRKAIISFDMRNGGKDARASFQLVK